MLIKCLNCFGFICFRFTPVLHFQSQLLSVALCCTKSKSDTDYIKNDMGWETTISPLISFTQVKYFSSCETYLFLVLHFIHFIQDLPHAKLFSENCLQPSSLNSTLSYALMSKVRVPPALSSWLNKYFILLA